jgi:hypothetical protein
MLDQCSPGHTRKLLKHTWCVMWNGKTYPSLPKGEHGAGDPDIEIGHVKRMIRALGIDIDCARQLIGCL